MLAGIFIYIFSIYFTTKITKFYLDDSIGNKKDPNNPYRYETVYSFNNKLLPTETI